MTRPVIKSFAVYRHGNITACGMDETDRVSKFQPVQYMQHTCNKCACNKCEFKKRQKKVWHTDSDSDMSRLGAVSSFCR